MRQHRIASVQLVLRAALLAPLVGCGIVTSTKAPQPVGSDPTSANVPVAPGGLQLGYVWQKDSQNLYPVLGVAGSAHFGGGLLPADTRIATAGAVASAGSSWAIVLRVDGTLQETQFPAGTTTTLAAHVPVDSTLVFSPSGAAAALSSASAHAVVVVNGLPLKAQVATIGLPGALTGVAVSDTGTILAGLKQAGASGIQVAVASETHSPAVLGSVQGWGGAAFVPSSVGSATEAAVFADSTSAGVSLIANVSGTSPSMSALTGGGLLQSPNGIGVSADGKWVFVTDGGKPQVVRLSLVAGGATPSSIPCACSPQQMIPQTADGIFSLTTSGAGQPNWMLDTRTAQPKTFFVPGMATANAVQSASVRAGGSQ